MIFVMMFFLVDRLGREFDNAERVQFEQRLLELNAAVMLMASSVIAKGDGGSVSQYEGANPMDWMESDTSHYLGEMSLADAVDKPGNWVYDPKLRVIAYLPKSEDLKSVNYNDAWLRFKVVALLSNDRLLNEQVVPETNTQAFSQTSRSYNQQHTKMMGLMLKSVTQQ
jgi:hypothetical protein